MLGSCQASKHIVAFYEKKKGENLFSYNIAGFWVSSACRSKHSTEPWGAGTTNTVMDTSKPYIYIPVHFVLAREHCIHFSLSAASLLPVNVVLEGPGVQLPYCPIRRGRSMRNQRKRVLGKPGPCPQGRCLSFLSAYFLTALL